MIWKLRWRFIGIAMVAFFFVSSLIASLTNIAYFYYVSRSNDETIKDIKENPQYEALFNDSDSPFAPLDFQIGAFNGKESEYTKRYFLIAVNSNENIGYMDLDHIASVSETDACVYAYKVLKTNGERGYIKAFRYNVFKVDDGVVIIFLDCEKDLHMIDSIRWMTILIPSLSLVLVFFLVLLFSDQVIKPYAQNIEVQKRFITDASHELKTPLTSISTSIEIIEMEHGSDEWTDNIKQQVSRMTGLISEMVTLSRLDEVKTPEKVQFDLSSAVWETLEYHIPQAKACNKEIKTSIQDKVSFVGDKASIQQMLSVLVENAIKYSTANSEIRFILKKTHGKIRIIVQNPCKYEQPPDVKRIFDRFYRPDESRNTSTGGNGIGLAIAKSVVEAHNGSISAACPDGKAMTITVEM